MSYLSEDALYYIWQNGRYKPTNLKTTKGETIVIADKGRRNLGQGPDFLNAEILIEGMRLYGAVEMHVETMDWFHHHHETDTNYNNVVLHVVYASNGTLVQRQDGTRIPELEISQFMEDRFVEVYQRLQQSTTSIACRAVAPVLSPLVITELVQRMSIERLERKALEVKNIFDKNERSWRETLWNALAGAFGGTTNRLAFEQLSTALPYLLLLKHRSEAIEIEALVFGVAGFLAPYSKNTNTLDSPDTQNTPDSKQASSHEEAEPDPYIAQLVFHWDRLQLKYQLKTMNPQLFHFGKMRPFNFPTVRLAQLAALTHHLPDLHALIDNPKQSLDIFMNIKASEHWDNRYRLDKLSKPIPKTIGKDFAYNLIINCLAPLSVLYFQTTAQNDKVSEIIDLLESLPTEKNAVIDEYPFFNVRWKNALETQALLELNKHYCVPKRCMECPAGRALLRN